MSCEIKSEQTSLGQQIAGLWFVNCTTGLLSNPAWFTNTVPLAFCLVDKIGDIQQYCAAL